MKYQTELDQKYALFGELQTNDRYGHFVLSKSDDLDWLVNLGKNIESGKAISNMIIIQIIPHIELVWKSSKCNIPPRKPHEPSEIVRWLNSCNKYPREDDPDIIKSACMSRLM